MNKVLVIAPYSYLPYYSGGQKFIAKFLAYLSAETQLTVITVPGTDGTLANNYTVKAFLKPGFTRYIDTSLVNKISRLISEHDINTVIWEHPYYAWLASCIKKKTGTRSVLHTHNIEYQRFRSVHKWWWPILKIYEKWAFSKADNILFITGEDMAFAVNTWKIDKSKCIILPFGIDMKEAPRDKQKCRDLVAERHGIKPGEKIILFNGLLDYKPNLDALKVILDIINPILLKQARFSYKIIICGKRLPAELDDLREYADKNIVYAGFVSDIETYFKGADLFLNPVQTGGGIKTKMVEAIGYGTTVIATESGAAGIQKDVCGSKLIGIPDGDWISFAKAIVANIDYQGLTPDVFYRTYNWDHIIRSFIGIISYSPQKLD